VIRLYAVAGNPVLPSLSPELFEASAADGAYVRLASNSAAHALQFAREAPLAGMNVTAPFKEDMAKLVTPGDDAVRTTGAVNVVVNRDGDMVGYNTDCMGVVEALRAHGLAPYGKRAVVFGAGGSAKAAAWALKSAGAGQIVIINRTFSRAMDAARRIGCDAAPLGELSGRLQQAEVFVSCVPRALEALPSLELPRHLVVLDADYHGSALERAAQQAGCAVVSGREWLLHQAVGTRVLFNGTTPLVDAMADFLRKPTHPCNKPSVALVGFMGAGKSTVGPLLASRLGLHFAETDEEVVRIAGAPDVRGIFEQQGEAAFRLLESTVVRRIHAARRTVFSLGGGALLDPDNLAAVRHAALVVWLWVDAGTAHDRAGDGTRPLLGNRDQARALLASRTDGYARAADLVIDTRQGSIAELADRIADEIRNAQRA
jgi:shikimate dehydrogenase